jgi:hypothetical protein
VQMSVLSRAWLGLLRAAVRAFAALLRLVRAAVRTVAALLGLFKAVGAVAALLGLVRAAVQCPCCCWLGYVWTEQLSIQLLLCWVWSEQLPDPRFCVTGFGHGRYQCCRLGLVRVAVRAVAALLGLVRAAVRAVAALLGLVGAAVRAVAALISSVQLSEEC